VAGRRPADGGELTTLFWFVVLVGILIFAHEGGHFTFAKLFRVKVLTFSLGFGTPIRLGRFKLSFKPGETEYRIAWFPIGGFVRMVGDDPTEEVPPEDLPRAFSSQKVWKRFLIIFGGPLFSICLALPIFFFYNLLQDRAAAAQVGSLVAGSPAAQAGLRPGDKVLEVDGRRVATWGELDDAVQDGNGQAVRLLVERRGQRLQVVVKPYHELSEDQLELLGKRWDLGLRHERQGNLVGVVAESPAWRAGLRTWDRLLAIGGVPVLEWLDVEELLGHLGPGPVVLTVLREVALEAGAVKIPVPVLLELLLLVPAKDGALPQYLAGVAGTGLEAADLYIKDVSPGLPAQKSGIVKGDKLLAIDGRPIKCWEQFSRAVAGSAGRSLRLDVRHGRQVRTIEFVPEVITQKNEFRQETRKLGLGVVYQRNLVAGRMIPRPHRLQHALVASFTDTGNVIIMNTMGFVRIFQGRVKASEAIGGPIMIADIAAKTARKGWREFVQMMAFLSVLLGMLNLLPIPILDGGHIMFLAIEAVRRKPVSIKTRLAAGYVGFALLAALMIFAFSNDIQRYWFSSF